MLMVLWLWHKDRLSLWLTNHWTGDVAPKNNNASSALISATIAKMAWPQPEGNNDTNTEHNRYSQINPESTLEHMP